MSNDNWSEALRKYEGALRVVPNDPQTEERLDMIRRIQRDYDQVAVNMNTIGGTLEEQVAQIASVSSLLSHTRQMLPNSQRLAQMQQELDNKLASIRSQVNDQAQMSLNHANNSTTLDERILLMNAAIKLMELGLELDPTDGTFSEMLMRSRNLQADITRAQQTIRRAQALVSQNFDAELAQARQMLAEMVGDYAQDERFRSTVNDLYSRATWNGRKKRWAKAKRARRAPGWKPCAMILSESWAAARIFHALMVLLRGRRNRGRLVMLFIFIILVGLAGVAAAMTQATMGSDPLSHAQPTRQRRPSPRP